MGLYERIVQERKEMGLVVPIEVRTEAERRAADEEPWVEHENISNDARPIDVGCPACGASASWYCVRRGDTDAYGFHAARLATWRKTQQAVEDARREEAGRPSVALSSHHTPNPTPNPKKDTTSPQTGNEGPFKGRGMTVWDIKVVQCPKCGALPGHLCHTPSGVELPAARLHKLRRERAVAYWDPKGEK